jgi:hypothetical protein
MAGDVDEDNRVGVTDLAILQSHFGTTAGAMRGDGDLNGDGAVNRLDAARLAINFGRSFAPPVPAPSGVAPSASPAAALVAGATDNRREVQEGPALTVGQRGNQRDAASLAARKVALVQRPTALVEAVDHALLQAPSSALSSALSVLRARRRHVE